MYSLMNGSSDTGSARFNRNRDFTNFAWALGAGCAYEVNENFAVDLGYRYVNLGTVNLDESGVFYDTHNDNFFKVNYDGKSFASNHEIMLGLRYTF